MSELGLSDEYFVAWVTACARLGIDPINLIRVAYSESNVRPQAHNHSGNAVGLIQFMPQTLMGLGWSRGWDTFMQLTAEEQVPYVEDYFRSHAKLCTTDALCYTATFLPALLPLAAAAECPEEFVLCGKAGPLAWAYKANAVLDRDANGEITVADLGRQLEVACKGARYDAIVARLGSAGPPLAPDQA